MAEAAGLVVGVLALAGTFKDCIDLFAYITASRNLGQDYDLLTTKLDCEKLLLLQWAHRVHLLHPDYDRRLDDPNTYKVISRVLDSIQQLLSDSQLLENRYGMQRAEQATTTTTTSGVNRYTPTRQDLVISQPQMARLLVDFGALRIQKKRVRNGIPLLYKARWAIHDKEKFERLIQDLSDFISKLDALVPGSGATLESMIKEDLRLLHFNNPHLSSGNSHERETIMAAAADLLARGNFTRVLNCLWFRVMDDRRITIRHAHKETFKWALAPHDENTEYKWDDLSHWFKHGSGIYWVSGKAGSGKSTLMKYMYELDETKVLLESWAGSRPLTIANFFFYALGSPEQKTQTGLERALLYQILKVEPSLIPELLPQIWQEALATSKDVNIHPPSPGELRTALAAFERGLKSTRKFCFFIDGLDEYDGDCFAAASTLRDLVTNLDIKIIVSSRPTSACVQSFRAYPTLRLQDLTQRDITCYVNDTIGSNFDLRRLTWSQPNLTQDICHEVISKASGVFLWVVLACRSLIEGLAAYDTLEDLHQRIDELPPELDDLFQHMLQRIERRYQAQAAKLLRICYQNKLAGSPDLPSIGLAIVEEAGFEPCKIPSHAPPPDSRRLGCQILEARLRSKCGGLLELQTSLRADKCICHAIDSRHDKYIDPTVVFIHRTLLEFLSQPGIWDLSCLQAHSSLDAEVMLSWSNLKLLQIAITRCDYAQGRQAICSDYLQEILVHAREADGQMSIQSIMHIMSALEELLQGILSTNSAYSFSIFGRGISTHDLLSIPPNCFPFAAALAAEVGMANSITKLLNRAKLPPHLSKEFLFYPLHKPLTKKVMEPYTKDEQLRIVRPLLSWGCSPNASKMLCNNLTPWRKWLDILQGQSLPTDIQCVDTTLAFIDAGADIEVLRSRLPSLHDRLLAIIHQCSTSLAEKQRAENVVLEIVRKITDRLNAGAVHSTAPSSPSVPGQSRHEQHLGSKRPTYANDEGPTKRIRIADILC